MYIFEFPPLHTFPLRPQNPKPYTRGSSFLLSFITHIYRALCVCRREQSFVRFVCVCVRERVFSLSLLTYIDREGGKLSSREIETIEREVFTFRLGYSAKESLLPFDVKGRPRRSNHDGIDRATTLVPEPSDRSDATTFHRARSERDRGGPNRFSRSVSHAHKQLDKENEEVLTKENEKDETTRTSNTGSF